MRINGYYLDGKTSKQLPAYIETHTSSASALTLQFEHKDDLSDDIDKRASTKYLEFDQLKIASRLANTPREISFGDSELFVTDDNDSIDSLCQLYGQSSSFLHSFESKITTVVFACIITIAAVWLFISYGVPASAKIIADKMPVSISDSFGSTLDILDETLFEPSELTLEEQQRILDLTSPYLKEHAAFTPAINFRSGMKANALALPNGDIVFTDDFIELVQNDEQLLAVLFHELGHLKHKHLIRRVLQDSMITLMVIMITGDLESVDILAGIPTLVLDLSYSRDFEIEADQYALQQLHQAKIPLQSFASVMQLLEDYYAEQIEQDSFAKDTPNFLLTHPSTEDRILLTKKMIDKYKNTKPMPADKN